MASNDYQHVIQKIYPDICKINPGHTVMDKGLNRANQADNYPDPEED